MRSLFTLESMTKLVLEEIPETRDEDNELALQVWQKFYGINPWAPVCEIMRNKCLPSVESIGRTRRRLQATDENLRGSKQKEKIRLEAQADFIEYALTDR